MHWPCIDVHTNETLAGSVILIRYSLILTCRVYAKQLA